MCRNFLAAGLLLLAGTSVSLAQPTLDGHLDAAVYGPAKWLQTLPTTFGDNRADLCVSIGNRVSFAMNNNNGGGVTGGTAVFDNTDPQYAAALAVTTGFEIRIPMSQLGGPTGAIRLAGFINNGGGNYLSNQLIGGFAFAAGATRGNLGADMNGGGGGDLSMVDLSNETQCPGNQYVTIPPNAGSNCTGSAPVLDGSLDASFYGAPLWVQNVQTQFGDPGYHDTNYNDGSEIDAVYAKICTADVGDGPQDYLFLFVAGNLQSQDNFGGNRLGLYIDTGAAGGLNQLTSVPSVDGIGGSIGLKFDTGFAANYYMDFGVGYNSAVSSFRAEATFAQLGTTAAGGIIGSGPSTTAIVGTGTTCPPDQTLSVGSELDGLYSYLDRTHNKLYLMFTGNLKQGDYITLFFDANGNPTGDEGQNTLHGSGNLFGTDTPNPQIGIADGGAGSLNRCGFDGTSPGLTFDTGFYADYYLNTHIESTNRQVTDCAVIRTHGRSETLLGDSLDYGSYDGINIPSMIPWDGTSFDQAIPATGVGGFPGSIQPQDGLTANPLSHFPPRESYRVLEGYINSNAGAFPPSNNTTDGTNPVWTDWLGVTTSGNPVAPANLLPRSGLIQARIDNSNVAGVTDTSGAGAASATSGFEMAIDLGEMGYVQRSRIRVAGFIINGSFTSVSNQVLGNPMSVTNLGDPRMINFSTDPNTDHRHYVVVASCAADYNEDGTVNVQDIFSFLSAWFAGDPRADIGGGGISVQDIFVFLAQWFAGPCIGG